MIDSALAGTRLPEVTTQVDRSQIRLFAKAIGETDPIYSDVEASKAHGHRDLMVPPTMLLGLLSAGDDLVKALMGAGANLATMLHGEQSFDYAAAAYAGDQLRLQSRIDRVYSKKGGAMEFVVQATDVVNADTDEKVATMEMTLIFRNGS